MYKRGENHEGTYYVQMFFLNRVIPDGETIYFVSIEQKKYNCLQKLPGVLMSKKDELFSK